MAVIDFRPDWGSSSERMRKRRARAFAKLQAPSTVEEMNRLSAASRKMAHLAIWAALTAICAALALASGLLF